MKQDSTSHIYPYKLAKLNNRRGDTTKRWYVEFWAYDVRLGKLRRKRLFSVNNNESLKDRYEFAKIQIESINKQLIEGYYFDDIEHERRDKEARKREYKDKYLLIVELKAEFDKQKKLLRQSTFYSNRSKLNAFIDYVKRINGRMFVDEFDSKKAKDYQLYLINEKKVSTRTANDRMIYIRYLFNQLIDNEILNRNPFKNIKKLAVLKSTSHQAFTDFEKKIIIEYLKENDIILYYYVSFIYYTYARPIELRKVQRKYIYLAKRKMLIPACVSKNKKDAYVYLPDALIKILVENDYYNANNDKYLFGIRSLWNDKEIGKNNMYNRHKSVLGKLGLKGPYTLYSWKHTGVCDAYLNGVDIKSIQLQCRHHDISETDTYLRSLGLYNNTGFENKINNLEL